MALIDKESITQHELIVTVQIVIGFEDEKGNVYLMVIQDSFHSFYWMGEGEFGLKIDLIGYL